MICVDLEDGVDIRAKDLARRALLDFLATAEFDARRLSVRINDPTTDLGRQDLAAIADLGLPIDLLLIPKAADTAAVDLVFKLCGQVRNSMVLIETARGLSNVFELAAHERVSALCFGSADWSTEIGCTMEWDALLYARSRIVHAAVDGGSIPIDGGWLQLDDEEGLESDSQRLRSLGFQGRVALHPKQVPVILRSFSPDSESVEHARRVIEAAKHNREGAFTVNGLMVDEPMIRRARHILESVGTACSNTTK
jgi:citrate lyase beta subunit